MIRYDKSKYRREMEQLSWWWRSNAPKHYTIETAKMALSFHKQTLHNSLWKPVMTMATSETYELRVSTSAEAVALFSVLIHQKVLFNYFKTNYDKGLCSVLVTLQAA